MNDMAKELCFDSVHLKLYKEKTLKTLIWQCNGVFTRCAFLDFIGKVAEEYESFPWYKIIIMDIRTAPPVKRYVVDMVASVVQKLHLRGLNFVWYTEPLNAFTRYNILEIQEKCNVVQYRSATNVIELEQMAFNMTRRCQTWSIIKNTET